MVRKFLPVLVIALAALGLAAGAFARPQTTGPGHVDNVKALLYNDHFSLTKATFLRGDSVRMIVTNKGTKPLRLKFGAVSTPLLKPGKKSIILAEMDFRGKFPLQLWGAGGQIATVFMKIT